MIRPRLDVTRTSYNSDTVVLGKCGDLNRGGTPPPAAGVIPELPGSDQMWQSRAALL